MAGETDNGGSNSDFAVAVYDSTGTLDNSFSTDGLATYDVTGNTFADSLAEAILLDNGHITLVGHSLNGANYGFFALQITSDGSVNNSFGSSGVISASGVGDVLITAALADSQGYIYALGHGNNGTDNDILFTPFCCKNRQLRLICSG